MLFGVAPLGKSVTTVNTEIRTSDVLGSITEQEGDGTHEVLGSSHLANRNQGGPLLVKLGVLVEDLASEGRQHITGANAVNPDVVTSPFDSKRCSQVSHSGLGGIVRSLGLRNVDNGTRHTANHDNATGGFTIHKVLGNSRGPQVSTIHVDTPELLDAVMWV